ncbi:hypothetical protein [Roseovarius ramblicola]|uniref:GTP cyclohydrolase 1 type 2 n=1 Tax=Roseovarius ramblicola TaxID=2022336 RepID=A0ABV5HZI6_9RHOB
MRDRGFGRYRVETGLRILVQLPVEALPRVEAAVLGADPLAHGDYDRVSFHSAAGVQRFRSCGGGRNRATEDTVEVDCIEWQVFTTARGAALDALIRAIYATHPYEEPVIHLVPAQRCRHRRGMDEDNPNRFWNRDTADWVPPAHR